MALGFMPMQVRILPAPHMFKRIIDFLFAIIGVVLLAPLLIYIAYKVKKSSPGPVFYRGTRVGKDGRLFRIFKFRTMVEDAEQIGGPSTAGDDPRLVYFGRVLKRWKFDELPQLFNILKGEMSFVGPRPEVQMYVNMMSQEQRNIILSVRPGITDWASIWNFREEETLRGLDNPEAYYLEYIRPTKIQLQMKYTKERNLWIDLKIVFETIWRIIN